MTDVHLPSVVHGLRGLGGTGLQVHAVGESFLSGGLWSRFAAARSVGPRPQDGDGFVAAISRLVEKDASARGRVVVYPGQEHSIDALQARRSTLPKAAVIACCQASALDVLRDKVKLAALAHESGIRTPATLARGRAGDIEASALPTPCMVKFARPGTGDTTFAPTPADLSAFLGQAPGGAELLVQEHVTGPLTALTVVLARDGSLVERFQQAALRTWPPGAGVSSMAVSVAPDEDFTQRVAAMLRSVGFWGMAQLQFIGGGGDAALIDFNPRFYGSLSLALAAGVNIPARWHSVVLDEPAGSPSDYRLGVTYRWLQAELLAARRDGLGRLERPPRPRAGAMWAADDPLASLALATGWATGALRARFRRSVADRSRPLATEGYGVDRALEDWVSIRSSAPTLVRRLRKYATAPPGARVLDVGAAQGVRVAALRHAGYSAVGVEPWAEARRVSQAVAERIGQPLEIVDGTAEDLPFPEASFHLIMAHSVMEHTVDPVSAAREAYRVLRPGGGFYFSTTSVLCPRQSEIRGFPAFPWYPDAVKKRLMRWAPTSRPALVGYTRTPAYHWFSPRRARRLAEEAGFAAVYDRWDVRGDEGMSAAQARLFRLLSGRTALRRAGDVLLEGSSYLFVK